MDYKKAYQELSQVVLESDNLGLMSKLKNINDQIKVEEEKPPKKEMDTITRQERKQQIIAERDPVKRAKLIRENMDLFKGEQ